MFSQLLIPSIFLLVATWPLGLILSLFAKLRFVDAYSHMLLPVLLILYFLFGSKLWVFVVIFPLFVWVINRFFSTKFKSTNFDVFFMGLSALGLNLAIVIINLFPKNWHLDSDILLFGNFDIFLLKNIEVFGFSMPLIYLLLGLLFVVNYTFYFVSFRSLHYVLIKGDAYFSLFSRSVMSTVLMLNLFVLFYLLGPFLLLGVLALPFAIAEIFSRNFSRFLEISLFLPLILLVSCFPLVISFDFSISQFIVSLLFVFWFVSFMLSKLKSCF